MAALPKRKISTYRGGKRFASRKKSLLAVVNCSKCGKKIRPHYICPYCEKNENKK